MNHTNRDINTWNQDDELNLIEGLEKILKTKESHFDNPSQV